MMEAFVIAGLMLMSQLGPAQQLQSERPDCSDRLSALVRTPFVLGYIFGSAAAAIDRIGIDHNDPDATAVIVGVHRLVFPQTSYEDCVRFSDQAVREPDFALGMHAAGVDADAFAFGKVPPVRLSRWLDAQLNVEAPSEKTQDEGE